MDTQTGRLLRSLILSTSKLKNILFRNGRFPILNSFLELYMHEPRHKISWEKYQNHWIVVEIFSDGVTNIITMIMLVKKSGGYER